VRPPPPVLTPEQLAVMEMGRHQEFWEDILQESSNGDVVDVNMLKDRFWARVRGMESELIPSTRIPWNMYSPMQVTHRIEGLNWAMTEEAFLERFGRFKDRRFEWGHAGIVAIKFVYREDEVNGSVLTKSDGVVFITFISEMLGYLFIQDFHGYTAMDRTQYWKGAYTRVVRADEPIHRRPKRYAQYGDARFDEGVWDFFGPCNDRQGRYLPEWVRLDEELERRPGSEYSERVNDIAEV
jgi:hypothetical protein